MSETIAVAGVVGSTPERRTTAKGAELATFRLASHLRRFDRETGRWVDASTNWYTVTAWRRLGQNVLASIEKGDRVIVTGSLKVSTFEKQDGSTGMSVDLVADHIGHDLTAGTTKLVRNPREERAASPSMTASAAGQDAFDETGAATAASAPAGEGEGPVDEWARPGVGELVGAPPF